MRFDNPTYLYLLILIPLLVVFYYWAASKRGRNLSRFGNPALVSRGAGVSQGLRTLKSSLMVTGATFLILTLAGPQWGATLEKIERQGVDVIVALDTSLSMLAQDIKPSRLRKAKHEINELIDMLQGDKIGIVVFAGTSYTLCPLTLDYSAAKMFVETISTDIVPEPGTAIADAIEASVDNFDEKENKYKVLILMTDGEDHGKAKGFDPVQIAEEASEQGVVIYTVGMGSPSGEPIPLEAKHGGVEYKRDKAGEVVMSKLAEKDLQEIALASGGKYYRVSADEFDLAKIYQKVAGMDKKTYEEEYHVRYEDRFQWPLAIAVLCFVAEALLPERRKRYARR